MCEILEGDYRGNPMMIIRNTPQDKFPFQFGIRKARLIVEHFEAIKKFAKGQTLEEKEKNAD